MNQQKWADQSHADKQNKTQTKNTSKQANTKYNTCYDKAM
jgi:hypothetical protein